MYDRDVEKLFGHPPTSISETDESGYKQWSVRFLNVEDRHTTIEFGFVFTDKRLLKKVNIPREYLAIVPEPTLGAIINRYTPGKKHDVHIKRFLWTADFMKCPDIDALLGPPSNIRKCDDSLDYEKKYQFIRQKCASDLSETPVCEVTYCFDGEGTPTRILSDFEGISFDIEFADKSANKPDTGDGK